MSLGALELLAEADLLLSGFVVRAALTTPSVVARAIPLTDDLLPVEAHDGDAILRVRRHNTSALVAAYRRVERTQIARMRCRPEVVNISRRWGLRGR